MRERCIAMRMEFERKNGNGKRETENGLEIGKRRMVNGVEKEENRKR